MDCDIYIRTGQPHHIFRASSICMLDNSPLYLEENVLSSVDVSADTRLLSKLNNKLIIVT